VESEIPMNCPKCKAVMETVKVDEIEVERCTSCMGLWFDSNEQDLLKGSKSAAVLDVGDKPADASEPHKIQCPVCHTPMISLAVRGHKGLKYESCTVCFGSFFDAGEFREYAGSGAGWFKKLLAAVR